MCFGGYAIHAVILLEKAMNFLKRGTEHVESDAFPSYVPLCFTALLDLRCRRLFHTATALQSLALFTLCNKWTLWVVFSFHDQTCSVLYINMDVVTN